MTHRRGTSVKLFAGALAAATLACLFAVINPTASHARTSNPALTLTGLNTPVGVAIAPNGDRYVSDQGDMTIKVFRVGSTTPDPAKTISGFSQIQGIAISPSGELFAGDLSVVKVFNLGSTVIKRTITGFGFVSGVSLSPSGNLYVANLFAPFPPTDGSEVFVVRPGQLAPDPALTLTGLHGPGGIAFAPSGRILVSNIGKLDLSTGTFDGKTVSIFEPGAKTPNPALTLTGLHAPSGVGVLDGKYYVGALGEFGEGSEVSVFDEGSTVRNPAQTLTGLEKPALMSFDKNGYLYVANNGGHTVSVFNPLITATFKPNDGQGSMAPQKSYTPAKLHANTFTRGGYIFRNWNTKANGHGTSYPNKATYPFEKNVTLYAQWEPKKAQWPTTKCVVAGGTASAGVKVATRPGCRTNAKQTVGTNLRFVPSTRGDVRPPRLLCVLSQGLRAPQPLPASSYGPGFYFCQRGALVVVTHGARGSYYLTWKAPATSTYRAYLKSFRFVI